MTDTEMNSSGGGELQLKYNNALEKAEAGDPAAALETGRLLFEGVGVKRNRGEAAKWFEAGFRAYRKLAQDGDAGALFALAACYDDGTGVFRDDRKATELYRQAAEKGNARAAFRLGMRYEFGFGAPRDTAAALVWYRAGAEGGDPDACRAVALASADDPAQAVFWHRKAADGGNGLSALDLARALLKGEGCGRDIPGALAGFEKAYDLGVPAAAADLGLFYYHAEGEYANDRLAALWLARAVESEQTGAYLPYADLLTAGRGVARDRKGALRLIHEAALDGDAPAQFELGRILYEGLDVGADREKGIRWWKESAYNGFAPARGRLAELGFTEADWSDPDELYDDDGGLFPNEE